MVWKGPTCARGMMMMMIKPSKEVTHGNCTNTKRSWRARGRRAHTQARDPSKLMLGTAGGCHPPFDGQPRPQRKMTRKEEGGSDQPTQVRKKTTRQTGKQTQGVHRRRPRRVTRSETPQDGTKKTKGGIKSAPWSHNPKGARARSQRRAGRRQIFSPRVG